MGVIRGEKVTFRKKDIVSLDQMPSSQVEDALVVHCPPPRNRSHVWHVARITFAFVTLLVLITGAVVGTVESGAFDEPLSRKAQEAFDAAIGPNYKAEVGSAVIRFTSDMRLAVEARDVNLIDQASGKHMSSMQAVRMVLDPFSLLQGRVAIADVDASGIALDTALLPAGKAIDIGALRIDSMPDAIEAAFDNMDFVGRFVERSGTNSVRISGFELKLASDVAEPLSLVVDNVTFTRRDPSTLNLSGEVALNGAVARLDVAVQRPNDRASVLSATLSNLDLTPLTLKRDPLGQPREGINTFADVSLSAVRGDGVAEPKVDASVKVRPGAIYMDRERQVLSGAEINLAYNSDHKTLEIAKSIARFEATTIPFSGALIDLDRLDASAPKGFGVDFLISGGTAAPMGSGEAPLTFDGQATGRFVAATKELQFDRVGVSSPLGSLFGSLHMRLAPDSPEISFGAQAENLQTAAVKQLWPFWMASKARSWALGNLFGGTVSNATISVFIPQGRLAQAAQTGNLQLGENELHIAFDVAGTRLDVPGEIPPIRSLDGHFNLNGPVIAVDVARGTSYFPSGRSVTLGPSAFTIANTYEKPLTARLKLSLSGAADAVGELLTFKPLLVLQRTEFKPENFAGKIDADVDATIGLINEQMPPPPVWKATLQLSNVDILKPVSGRKITDLDGRIDADMQQVHLVAQGQIDGIPAQIDMVEPADGKSTVKRQRIITATLGNAQREAVMPGTGDIVDGPVKVELTRIDDDRQSVKIDLTKASLTVPWVGWSKGSGVPASASFEASGPADQTLLKGFELKGDDFGAVGDVVVGKGGLTSAELSSVRLSSSDDFALSIKRGKGGFTVAVSGNTADARPILAKLKAAADGSGSGSGDSGDVTVRARLDKVVGFNNETIGNFNATFATSNGRISTADVSGVTRSGQAVVSEMVNGGDKGTIHITSSDAGSVGRFADIYNHMNGGLLNLSLRASNDNAWDGSIDIRRFSIMNEKRLQSIVSTPTGRNGESLNSAVKQTIDTSSQSFQRGFARLSVRDGTFSVENGVVRGDQLGATFQGIVKDHKGNIDLTGTFMPAYGLNRLFAELPVIGFLLGNGSDRGLIGITFKLTGAFDSPNLQINPLSIIAPGVFRQIFEFQ